MSERSIRCPCCGAEFFEREALKQIDLPLGPIALADTKKLDAKEQISSKMVHACLDDHDHALKEHPKKHEHDHACMHRSEELTPAEQDLLDQIEELTATENRTAHFLTTWIKRIHDHPNQVFAAIGEVRRMKREKEVRKSIGGSLNWHFENFREAARRQARKSA
jgi:hypothetical protein